MKDFKLLIEEFLNEYDKPRTIMGYRRKIMVFAEFLKLKMSLVEKNYETLLRSIDKDAICRSVNYYINDYHIKFRITAENYFTVVSLFFKYIDKNYSITNQTFINSNAYENLKNKVNQIIQTLKKGRGKEPLSENEFEKLRVYCDYVIDNFNPETQYMAFCSAMIIKLTMFIGLKSNVIDKITVASHDKIKLKLRVNGYTIRLPDTLAQQLEKYRQVRKTVKPYSSDSPLFLNSVGKMLNNKNSEKYYSMLEPLNHQKSESIAKKAIINMLSSGVTSDVIKDLTGFTEKVCQECMEVLKEGKDFRADNRTLDAHLRSMKVYDLL